MSLGDVDFAPISESLFFNNSIQEQSVTVTILDDNSLEGNETFTLSLTVPEFPSVTASAVVTIVDNPTGRYHCVVDETLIITREKVISM